MPHGSPWSLALMLIGLGVVPWSVGPSPGRIDALSRERFRQGRAPLVVRSAGEAPPRWMLRPVVVQEVLAPDKLVVQGPEGPELVRLLGVQVVRARGYRDELLFERATTALARCIQGHRVWLKFDPAWGARDADGDWCAWVVRAQDQLPVNLEMVRCGFLLPERKFQTQWHPLLQQAAQEASKDRASGSQSTKLP